MDAGEGRIVKAQAWFAMRPQISAAPHSRASSSQFTRQPGWKAPSRMMAVPPPASRPRFPVRRHTDSRKNGKAPADILASADPSVPVGVLPGNPHCLRGAPRQPCDGGVPGRLTGRKRLADSNSGRRFVPFDEPGTIAVRPPKRAYQKRTHFARRCGSHDRLRRGRAGGAGVPDRHAVDRRLDALALRRGVGGSL
jgi:hypothetical protein